MTGHRVRVSPFGPVRRLWCRCGWTVAVSEGGAADAAEAHCWTVHPDGPVVLGSDDGGWYCEPEERGDEE